MVDHEDLARRYGVGPIIGGGPVVAMPNGISIEPLSPTLRLTAEQAIREVLDEFDEVKGFYIEAVDGEGRKAEASAAIAVASVLARIVRKGLDEEADADPPTDPEGGAIDRMARTIRSTSGVRSIRAASEPWCYLYTDWDEGLCRIHEGHSGSGRIIEEFRVAPRKSGSEEESNAVCLRIAMCLWALGYREVRA